jgi:anthranilate/para-aminobenzoate synthase component I
LIASSSRTGPRTSSWFSTRSSTATSHSANAAPYNAYLDLGRFVIVSASPELFFSRSGDELLLRPMKGTARRGRDLAEDRRRAATLRTSAKERAKNVMIVDLVRPLRGCRPAVLAGKGTAIGRDSPIR